MSRLPAIPAQVSSLEFEMLLPVTQGHPIGAGTAIAPSGRGKDLAPTVTYLMSVSRCAFVSFSLRRRLRSLSMRLALCFSIDPSLAVVDEAGGAQGQGHDGELGFTPGKWAARWRRR